MVKPPETPPRIDLISPPPARLAAPLTPEVKRQIAELTPTTATNVTVTVLGGGIAGLSAAHELIVRGFKVRVIERSVGSLPRDGLTSQDALKGLSEVDLGGVARSQWATTAPTDSPNATKSTRTLAGLGDYTLIDDSGKVVDGGVESRDKIHAFIAIKFDNQSKEYQEEEITRLSKWRLASGKYLQVVALNYEDRRNDAPGMNPNEPLWGPSAALERVRNLKAVFGAITAEWLPATMVTVPVDTRTYAAFGARGAFPGVLVRSHRSTDLLPGEHGFRFFPGFYWHLRNTMFRTPIYDFSDPKNPKRTNSSVHDNLNEVDWQIMADPTRPLPTAFRRKPPASVEEFIEQWQTLRNDLGFRESDMLRFMLRLGRFAASSYRRRREQYARMTWWDFVSLRKLDDLNLQTVYRGGFRRVKPDAARTDAAKKPQADRAPTSIEDDDADFSTETLAAWRGRKTVNGEQPKPESPAEQEASKNAKTKEQLDNEARAADWASREAFLVDSLIKGPEGQLDVGTPDRLPYGLRFRRALRHSPRALVAMDAMVTDAHTQGMLAIQLAMDQLGLNAMTDSTLNGPTSDAWFRHWHRYLDDEGVDFIPGEVTSIDVETGKFTYERSDMTPEERTEYDAKHPIDDSQHYVICAMDPVNVAKILTNSAKTKAAAAAAAAAAASDNAEETRGSSILQVRGEMPSLEDLQYGFTFKWTEVLKHKDKDPQIAEIHKNLCGVTPKQIWEDSMLPDRCGNFVEYYRDWVYGWQRATPDDRSAIDPQKLILSTDNSANPQSKAARAGKDEPNRQDGRFQVLTGIQLFFKRPTAFEHGHIYFAESPWGLMGMSQLQHWRGWKSRQTGIRGNLSLVYGSWRPEKFELGDFVIRRLIVEAQKAHPIGSVEQPEITRETWRSPGEMTCDELADETRLQVAWCRGTDAQFRDDLHVPEISHYHMDDYIQYRGSGGGRAVWNLCPYLINLHDDWDNRPHGEPWNPNSREGRLSAPQGGKGYRVYGRVTPIVFAGSHTRTYTRMSTMEAANESARHAVNSVLWHLSMRREAAEAILNAEELIKRVKVPGDVPKNEQVVATVLKHLETRSLAETLGDAEGILQEIGATPGISEELKFAPGDIVKQARSLANIAAITSAHVSARPLVRGSAEMLRKVDELLRFSQISSADQDSGRLKYVQISESITSPFHVLFVQGGNSSKATKPSAGKGVGSLGRQRPPVRPLDLPVLQTSWFGDFCEVRNHEEYEIPFLDFMKKLDDELYSEWSGNDDAEYEDSSPHELYPTDDNRIRGRPRKRRPHLFDLLQIDSLPDRIDAGEFTVDDTLRTLYSLGGVLLQSIRGPEPVKSVLNLIDSFDALFVKAKR